MQELKNCLSKENSLIFVELLESLLYVHKREQFFSWLQGGTFQTLFPHEILICAVADKNRSQLYFNSFSSTRYFKDHHLNIVTNKNDGLIISLIESWKKNYKPIYIDNKVSKQKLGSYLSPLEVSQEKLRENELINIAAHGVEDSQGDLVSFFSFSRIAGQINLNHVYLLELLVPQMHSAYLRILKNGNHNLNQRDSSSNEKIISLREVEVLNWVYEGKTNPEISIILSISINTVKNHVHSTISKLGVENRAQAASKAHKLGLLR